jgi:hypothetical protein
VSHLGRAVFRPKDLSKGRRRIIENALSDINPDIKGGVIELLSSWQGMPSEMKLKEMLGEERARSLLDRVSNNRNQKQQL